MMNIKGAIAHAKYIGREGIRETLKEKLWPNQTDTQRNMNINNLISGRAKTLRPEWVSIVCKECAVDANYLFDVKKMEE